MSLFHTLPQHPWDTLDRLVGSSSSLLYWWRFRLSLPLSFSSLRKVASADRGREGEKERPRPTEKSYLIGSARGEREINFFFFASLLLSSMPCHLSPPSFFPVASSSSCSRLLVKLLVKSRDLSRVSFLLPACSSFFDSFRLLVIVSGALLYGSRERHLFQLKKVREWPYSWI